MRLKGKWLLGSAAALTILSVLLIGAGLAHTRSVAAEGYHGAYGFRPGEWQMTTITSGPLIGTSRSTSMRCSHNLYQPQSTVNATLSTPGSSPVTVHCVTTHPSRHETLQNCRNSNPSDLMTVHTLYTGEGKHFQMQEHGRIVDNGKLFEAYTMHGKWLSEACLAHPPAPITEQIKPSKQMQRIEAQLAQSKIEAAQIKKELPEQEAQNHAALAAMKTRIAKLEAKDARAGVVIPASP